MSNKANNNRGDKSHFDSNAVDLDKTYTYEELLDYPVEFDERITSEDEKERNKALAPIIRDIFPLYAKHCLSHGDKIRAAVQDGNLDEDYIEATCNGKQGLAFLAEKMKYYCNTNGYSQSGETKHFKDGSGKRYYI